MFRVYSRAVILAVIFLAGITALFLNVVSRIVTKKSYLTICIAVFILISFEYWQYSGDLIYDTTKVPEVYQWLSNEKEAEVIAEYPMMSSIDASHYTYLFFQRVHKKKLVNAAPPGSKAWEFYKKVNDISNAQSVKLLKEIGTDYVIIHFNKYKEGMIPYQIKKFYSIDLSSITYNGSNSTDLSSITNNEGNSPIVPYGLKLYKDFGNDKVFVFK